jgi:GntR family transcriptional regulator/MocR family aminotransferase
LRDRTVSPAIALDRTAPEPLHVQIAGALRQAIAGGRLSAGTALPSSRELARRLGVSRNTVLTAYEELAADGLLTGRAGSATHIAGGMTAPQRPEWRTLLRQAQFPAGALDLADPDGTPLYLHR